MIHSPLSPASFLPARFRAIRQRPNEDLIYQLVTVAAIVVVLASVWVF